MQLPPEYLPALSLTMQSIAAATSTAAPPPAVSEPSDAQFMIAKYEAEQRQNAEILRQMKLKAGKK